MARMELQWGISKNAATPALMLLMISALSGYELV